MQSTHKRANQGNKEIELKNKPCMQLAVATGNKSA